MAAVDNFFFYEDEVFRVNSKGFMQFGTVIENSELVSSNDETSDDEYDGDYKMKKGHIRVAWHPSGFTEVVSETKVGLADRSLMPGDVVKRLVKDKNTQRGYCSDMKVVATVQVVGTKLVIENLPTSQLAPLAVFSKDLAVYLDHWVGVIRDVHMKLLVSCTDGSRAYISDPSLLKSLMIEKKSKCLHEDFPRKSDFYPGQRLLAPRYILSSAQWISKTSDYDKLAARHKHLKLSVERMDVDFVDVTWRCTAFTGNSAQPCLTPRDSIVKGDDLKRLRVLNHFEACTMQVGDRVMFTPSCRDAILPLDRWRERKREQMLATGVPLPLHHRRKHSRRKTKKLPSWSDAPVSKEPAVQQTDLDSTLVDPDLGAQVTVDSVSDTTLVHGATNDAKDTGDPRAVLTETKEQTKLVNENEVPSIYLEFASEGDSEEWDTENSPNASDYENSNSCCTTETSSVASSTRLNSDSSRLNSESSNVDPLQNPEESLTTSLSALSPPVKRRSVALATRLMRRRNKAKQRTRGKKVQPLAALKGEDELSNIVGRQCVVEILCTQSFADVVWQDGSIEQNISSMDLYPIHYLDEKEFFPGDFVVEERGQMSEYGVVREMDHVGRTAKIQWFVISHADGDSPQYLGEKEMSVYDIKDHPDFQFRPGSVVMNMGGIPSGLTMIESHSKTARGVELVNRALDAVNKAVASSAESEVTTKSDKEPITEEDEKVYVGQVLDNFPEGRIKVYWVDGSITSVWPQDLYKIGDYNSDDGELWATSSEDSWETDDSLFDGDEETDYFSDAVEESGAIEQQSIPALYLDSILSELAREAQKSNNKSAALAICGENSTGDEDSFAGRDSTSKDSTSYKDSNTSYDSTSGKDSTCVKDSTGGKDSTRSVMSPAVSLFRNILKLSLVMDVLKQDLENSRDWLVVYKQYLSLTFNNLTYLDKLLDTNLFSNCRAEVESLLSIMEAFESAKLQTSLVSTPSEPIRHSTKLTGNISGGSESKCESKLSGKIFGESESKSEFELTRKISSELESKSESKLPWKISGELESKSESKLTGKISGESKSKGESRKIFSELESKSESKLTTKISSESESKCESKAESESNEDEKRRNHGEDVAKSVVDTSPSHRKALEEISMEEALSTVAGSKEPSLDLVAQLISPLTKILEEMNETDPLFCLAKSWEAKLQRLLLLNETNMSNRGENNGANCKSDELTRILKKLNKIKSKLNTFTSKIDEVNSKIDGFNCNRNIERQKLDAIKTEIAELKTDYSVCVKVVEECDFSTDGKSRESLFCPSETFGPTKKASQIISSPSLDESSNKTGSRSCSNRMRPSDLSETSSISIGSESESRLKTDNYASCEKKNEESQISDPSLSVSWTDMDINPILPALKEIKDTCLVEYRKMYVMLGSRCWAILRSRLLLAHDQFILKYFPEHKYLWLLGSAESQSPDSTLPLSLNEKLLANMKYLKHKMCQPSPSTGSKLINTGEDASSGEKKPVDPSGRDKPVDPSGGDIEEPIKVVSSEMKLCDKPVNDESSSNASGVVGVNVNKFTAERVKLVFEHIRQAVEKLESSKSGVDNVKSTKENTNNSDNTKPSGDGISKSDSVKTTGVSSIKYDSVKPTGVSSTKSDSVKPTGVSSTKSDSVKPTGVSSIKSDSVKPTGVSSTKSDSVKPTSGDANVEENVARSKVSSGKAAKEKKNERKEHRREVTKAVSECFDVEDDEGIFPGIDKQDVSSGSERNPVDPIGTPGQILSTSAVSNEGFVMLDSLGSYAHRYAKRSFSVEGSQGKEFFKALRKEMALLRSSLPPGIWVRGFEDRLDLLSVMIEGPRHTPYEDGLFYFDFQLPLDYPLAPPLCHYISYCSHRLNPNLYETGKVCVSLLGTWSGRGTEVWTAQSTLLQLLVSIQALILNAEPYYNEAGYERQRLSQHGRENARMYNELVLLRLIRAMESCVLRPPAVWAGHTRRHFRERAAGFAARLEHWLSVSGEMTAEREGKVKDGRGMEGEQGGACEVEVESGSEKSGSSEVERKNGSEKNEKKIGSSEMEVEQSGSSEVEVESGLEKNEKRGCSEVKKERNESESEKNGSGEMKLASAEEVRIVRIENSGVERESFDMENSAKERKTQEAAQNKEESKKTQESDESEVKTESVDKWEASEIVSNENTVNTAPCDSTIICDNIIGTKALDNQSKSRELNQSTDSSGVDGEVGTNVQHTCNIESKSSVDAINFRSNAVANTEGQSNSVVNSSEALHSVAAKAHESDLPQFPLLPASRGFCLTLKNLIVSFRNTMKKIESEGVSSADGGNEEVETQVSNSEEQKEGVTHADSNRTENSSEKMANISESELDLKAEDEPSSDKDVSDNAPINKTSPSVNMPCDSNTFDLNAPCDTNISHVKHSSNGEKSDVNSPNDENFDVNMPCDKKLFPLNALSDQKSSDLNPLDKISLIQTLDKSDSNPPCTEARCCLSDQPKMSTPDQSLSSRLSLNEKSIQPTTNKEGSGIFNSLDTTNVPDKQKCLDHANNNEI